MPASTHTQRFHQIDWNDRALYLSFDESWVEDSANARLEFQTLAKHPASPVLEPSEDWEGGSGGRPRPRHQDPFLTSMVRDLETDEYVLWYHTQSRLVGPTSDPAMGKSPPVQPAGGGTRCCLARSRDGITWQKPTLGLVPYFGSAANNMFPLPGPPLASDHLSVVFPTRHPGAEAPLAASIYSQFPDDVYPRGITQMYGSDGIHWRLAFPPSLPLDGDAHCLVWDSNTQSYLLTSRSAQHARIFARLRSHGYKLPDKRHIALAQSRDLIHWTPLQDILEADGEDPPNAQLYQMQILPYGNVYIGFVQVFLMGKTMSDGPIETQLAISRDLISWKRAAHRRPFIANDGPGVWDSAHTTLTNAPPFADGDRLRFWYSGKDTDHWQIGNAALGTGTLRRDGFACWHSESEGCVTSIPLEINWASWPEINFQAPQGTVQVEFLDEGGTPISGLSRTDCEPLSGDEIRGVCKFAAPRGTFARHSGRIRLRFHLRNASLYAFRAPNIRRSV